jgi:hypothetical protein
MWSVVLPPWSRSASARRGAHGRQHRRRRAQGPRALPRPACHLHRITRGQHHPIGIELELRNLARRQQPVVEVARLLGQCQRKRRLVHPNWSLRSAALPDRIGAWHTSQELPDHLEPPSKPITRFGNGQRGRLWPNAMMSRPARFQRAYGSGYISRGSHRRTPRIGRSSPLTSSAWLPIG